MPLPAAPIPGMVARYAFLWSHEAAQGRREASKNRPCVIVLARRRLADGRFLVVVAPITHRKPDSDNALLIPPKLKRHLNLDADASWVVMDELNQFVWPGVDLRPVSREKGTWTYGILPEEFFAEIRGKVRSLVERRAANVTKRGD